MAKQNSKALKEERKKASTKAAYIGTAAALIIVGVVGVVIWLVNYSPNLPVYQVGEYAVKKDLFTCTYYYNTMTAQDWKAYGFDIYKSPYEQKFDYEAEEKSFDNWGDYFEYVTENTLKYLLVMRDTAAKGDYTYTDEVRTKTENELATIDKEKGAKSTKEYMLETYGAQISKKTLEEYLTLYYQAQEFYKKITESKAMFNKYIGGNTSVFEKTYQAHRDEIDVVSFRYYTMLVNSENESKIAALRSAGSPKEFQALCNEYSGDENYAKEDKSLYQNASLQKIGKISNNVIADALMADSCQAGDILYSTYQKDGKTVAEIVYVVSPRQKNTQFYNESDVQQWEFATMSILLEEYYNAHYKIEVKEDGLEEFRKQMIIPQEPTSQTKAS